MPSDEDIALDEKRLYGKRREETVVYVASGAGVAEVAASDDQIGRFGLAHQCAARDVAGANGRLLVATDEDVLIGTDEGFEATGFGPAVAVGAGTGEDGAALAAAPDGTVARLTGDDWVTVGEDLAVNAIDGDLLATADGVYRVGEAGASANGDGAGGLAQVGEGRGLGDVHDVAAAGPYAATDRGVFRLRDGRWLPEVGDAATAVAAEPGGSGTDGRGPPRAHAVVADELRERTAEGWRRADAPRAGVVDVAYGEAAFAVTGDGAVLLDPVAAKDGAPDWRVRSLGLPDVVGVAVP